MNVPGGRVFLGIGVSPNGMVKSSPQQPKTLEGLEMQLAKERGETDQGQIRGPAGHGPGSEADSSGTAQEAPGGLNLFHLIKGLAISLEANDKAGVQDSLEGLDSGLEQVVLTRSQVGSRGTVLDNFMQTIEKQKVDNKSTISSLEDADVFSTVSDINKTESTLQATLETSGKLIQPSLLQFLR
jgi:flagellar hook-associated protein 3 FlgL